MNTSEIVMKWINRKHPDLTWDERNKLLADIIAMFGGAFVTEDPVTEALLIGLDALVRSETRLDMVKDFMAEYDEELEILERAEERMS